MKRLVFLMMAALSAAAFSVRADCPPQGYDKARLEALKAGGWAMADGERDALALELADCLASPDPDLRDGLAYEGLDRWLRGNQLKTETVLALGDRLQGELTAPQGEGYERPFAALVLADVARVDRLTPIFTAERRASLVDAAVDYLTNIRDYRGFDDHDGWRHGVAHGADLMLQLALNPALGKPELTRIRDAVASQISPAGHFYIYGEGDRLAAPILYIAQRKVFTQDEWTAWLQAVASPAPLASWNDAFVRNDDLARVHNVNAFVRALYLNASLDSNSDDDVLLPGAKAALLSLP